MTSLCAGQAPNAITAYGDLFRIELHACDAGRNLMRFYQIAAVRLVQACLKRRQSAPKRIGIAYEVHTKFDPDKWAVTI